MNYTRSFISFISLFLMIIFGISCKDSSDTKKADDDVQSENTVDYEAMSLEPSVFATDIKKGGAVIVDLGYPADFEQGHIEGAININFFEPGFQSKVLELDKNKKYYVYSKNDARTKRTAIFMKQNGFNEVYILKGGWDAWKENEKK